jgi:hypothetical protein
MTPDDNVAAGERDDIIETLAAHRFFLRRTAEGLTDEQARMRTTVSELCIGGIIKHVSAVEETWATFVVEGPSALGAADEAAMEAHAAGFRMGEDETLAGLLGRYEEVAARTTELVRTLPSFDASQLLPEAPWFKPGARWSARRALLHVIAETSQHAGHADIIREALDGSKTMG